MREAVVTGGTGGLGRAVVDVLTAGGWKVAALGRLDLDLTDPDRVQNYFTSRDAELLICAAGKTADAPVIKMTAEQWEDVFSLNYRAAATCARAMIRSLEMKQQPGHVILISSYSAVYPPIGQSSYAAAKAALLGLTRDLAAEHGLRKIRVNAILPGFLETPMTATVSPERKRQVLEEHVLGELNTLHSVAKFIHFLHEELPHTSGQAFQLDSRCGFLHS